jgi:hypothetical protein
VVTTDTGDAGEGGACLAAWGAAWASGGFGIGMDIFICMVCADRPRAAKRAAPDAKARWRKVRRLLIRTPEKINCGKTKGWSKNATLPLPGRARGRRLYAQSGDQGRGVSATSK